ncbi:MAG: plasmid pRiA4b ORF-3 family protein, partial [Hymenobacter sp.]|nr:plasmid pRiA4b ORF-3 family protein [Hymenobacter sp.]
MPDTLTFWEMHFVLQILFDWESSHLFEFRQGRGTPDEFLTGSPPVHPTDRLDMPEWQRDPRDVLLSEILTAPRRKLTYVYDFGDNWEHELVVEKVGPLAPDQAAAAVRCLTGRRAAPPEDIGGFPGYERLVDLLAEKAAGQRKRLPSEYAGLGKFDPEEFDLPSFNHDLGLLREIVAEENNLLAEYAHQPGTNAPAPNLRPQHLPDGPDHRQQRAASGSAETKEAKQVKQYPEA